MTNDDRSRPGRLLPATTFAVGLLLGVLVGVTAGRQLAATAPKNPWIDAGLRWEVLPSHAPAGELPRVLTVPAKAFDYGAASQPIGPLIRAQTAILRVEAEAKSGKVGMLLTSPDGATVLSKERPLAPKDGKTVVYFSITPQTPPAIVVVRNYDAEGVPGAVTVRAAAYAPMADLSTEQLSAINKAGVY